jgi:hypothetical protein
VKVACLCCLKAARLRRALRVTRWAWAATALCWAALAIDLVATR